MTKKAAVVGGGVRKVVINACFGGFSLSPAAVRRLAELNGRSCYFFVREVGAGGFGPYRQVTEAEAAKAFMWHAFDIPNPETLDHEGRWHEMTMAERQAHNENYRAHALDSHDIPRDDPKLVAVVEELGERAGSKVSDLRIVEIPADAEWHIEEYDGNEHVAETHRTWR